MLHRARSPRVLSPGAVTPGLPGNPVTGCVSVVPEKTRTLPRIPVIPARSTA